MQVVIVAFVAVGMFFAFVLGIQGGFTVQAIVILAFTLAAGALAIAVIKRSSRSEIGPERCGKCGGLNSPNAPYCKHCGAQLR